MPRSARPIATGPSPAVSGSSGFPRRTGSPRSSRKVFTRLDAGTRAVLVLDTLPGAPQRYRGRGDVRGYVRADTVDLADAVPGCKLALPELFGRSRPPRDCRGVDPQADHRGSSCPVAGDVWTPDLLTGERDTPLTEGEPAFRFMLAGAIGCSWRARFAHWAKRNSSNVRHRANDGPRRAPRYSRGARGQSRRFGSCGPSRPHASWRPVFVPASRRTASSARGDRRALRAGKVRRPISSPANATPSPPSTAGASQSWRPGGPARRSARPDVETNVTVFGRRTRACAPTTSAGRLPQLADRGTSALSDLKPCHAKPQTDPMRPFGKAQWTDFGSNCVALPLEPAVSLRTAGDRGGRPSETPRSLTSCDSDLSLSASASAPRGGTHQGRAVCSRHACSPCRRLSTFRRKRSRVLQTA